VVQRRSHSRVRSRRPAASRHRSSCLPPEGRRRRLCPFYFAFRRGTSQRDRQSINTVCSAILNSQVRIRAVRSRRRTFRRRAPAVSWNDIRSRIWNVARRFGNRSGNCRLVLRATATGKRAFGPRFVVLLLLCAGGGCCRLKRRRHAQERRLVDKSGCGETGNGKDADGFDGGSRAIEGVKMLSPTTVSGVAAGARESVGGEGVPVECTSAGRSSAAGFNVTAINESMLSDSNENNNKGNSSGGSNVKSSHCQVSGHMFST
jgi:hypothetical protein